MLMVPTEKTAAGSGTWDPRPVETWIRTQTASADHSLILMWGWEQSSSRCEVTTTHQVSTLDMFTRPVSKNLATVNSEGSLLTMARANDSVLKMIKACIRWVRLSSLRLQLMASNRLVNILASTGRSCCTAVVSTAEVSLLPDLPALS